MSDHSIKCAGIDVSKSRLDVALHGSGDFLQISNDAEGFEALRSWLEDRSVRRVGLESSGCYGQDVTRYLRSLGFEVIVFEPEQVQAYARYQKQKAKNDRIDARLIAACAADVKKCRDAPDERLEDMAAFLTRLKQIDEDIGRAKTQREAFLNRPVLYEELTAEIKRLKALRRQKLASLAASIRSHEDLGRRLDLLESIDGIGLRTALALLIRMPELGSLSREQCAALAGLAPYDRDSGTHRRRRHIAGGRARLRKSLYAAALPAAFHWNKALKELYARLKTAGKPHKLALIACARKLIIYANAVIERQKPWRA